MDDRELTNAAAKAAGLWDSENNCVDIPWSPLTNDGDALRLAVKLRLDIDFAPKATWLGTKKDAPVPLTFENHKEDPYAATRRAIVRAAAALQENRDV